MNMSQTNIRVILILLAVAVLGGVYLYVYKPNMEDKDSIQSEVNDLQTRYDELKALEVHRDEYIAQTAEYDEKFAEAITDFPATLDQEITVMFAKGIEKDQGNLQMQVDSIALNQPELFYSLGSGGAAAAEGEEATDDTTVATAGGTYDCYTASFPIQYEGSYEGIKDLIDYIMAYKYRMNVTSLDIAYDAETDIYSGTIIVNAYCVAGEGREADTVTTNVQNGVENIFLGGGGASVPSVGGSGVSAASSDVKVTLNNANNDSTPGIVVAAGSSSVSYTDNDVATMNVSLEDNDGKVTATISLDGDEITVDLADGATSFGIYVNSSDRVDADDTNGIKININNDTDVSVAIKVNGDDSDSPRVEIGKKTGTVSVD